MSRSERAIDAGSRPIRSVTIAGSVSIGAGAPPNGGAGGTLLGERPDEAVAVEHGLQRVPDERIGSPQGLQDGGAARRRGQPPGDVHEQSAAGHVHGPGVVICQNDSPSGFMASVIICWWPTET